MNHLWQQKGRPCSIELAEPPAEGDADAGRGDDPCRFELTEHGPMRIFTDAEIHDQEGNE